MNRLALLGAFHTDGDLDASIGQDVKSGLSNEAGAA